MAYNLAIIGSGGGAYAAAIAARRRDLTVAMIEQGAIGGTCVNTGCVPSKALLAAAQARHTAAAHPFAGIATSAGPVDWPAMRQAKTELVEQMRASKYIDLANEYGWQIMHGTASFTGTPDQPALQVVGDDGRAATVEADHYLVATGSAQWAPPIPGLAEVPYLTSTTAMDLDQLPTSMIVLGGNVIGLEQAQLFARLGVTVTVIEALDRFAPFDEPEISESIQRVFADEGISVYTGATTSHITRDHDGYTVTLTGATGQPHDLHGQQLLVATGRWPATAALKLDSVGVTLGEHGAIVVDPQLRTANPRIWAAGDVTGVPQYVYVAAAHGNLMVDNAFGQATGTVDYRNLPRVTFTAPAIASAGLTEAQAIAAGHRCDCRVLPLDYVPRAIVNRDTRGLIKLVADADTGRLLGAHLIADGAGDVISAAVYAIRTGMTITDLADTWCPYLTMAEALKLAAQTYTRDVAHLSCCAG